MSVKFNGKVTTFFHYDGWGLNIHCGLQDYEIESGLKNYQINIAFISKLNTNEKQINKSKMLEVRAIQYLKGLKKIPTADKLFKIIKQIYEISEEECQNFGIIMIQVQKLKHSKVESGDCVYFAYGQKIKNSEFQRLKLAKALEEVILNKF